MFFATTLHSEDLCRAHKLQMDDEDYRFYNDQTCLVSQNCLDVLLLLTSSDQQFIQHSQLKPNFTSSSTCPSEMEIDSAADNVSESESTSTNSSQSQVVPIHLWIG